MAASKRVKARVDRAAQAATGGKPPIWCEAPPWAPPRADTTGPDYAPAHDVNEWGVDRWHGQRDGYRVELIAMRPPGHRWPSIDEGLAEVSRRLEAGPPPAPPRPVLPTAEPGTTPRPIPTRKEAPSDYVSRCLRETKARDLSDAPVAFFDPNGADAPLPTMRPIRRADY